MKKFTQRCLIFLLVLVVSGCAKKEPKIIKFDNISYTYVEDNVGSIRRLKSEGKPDLIIEKENSEPFIVTYDNNEYTCTLVGSNKITVTYPNGEKAWHQYGDSINCGGGEVDNTPRVGDFYALLLEVNSLNKSGGNIDGGMMFFGFIVIIMGIISAIFPEFFWELKHGWRYKKAEPSELALAVNKFGGIVSIIIGIILFFGSCSA